jgi:hypothetical protein
MDNTIKSSEWKRLQGERWTQEDARRVLAAWQSSGDSLWAFSRRHGLQPQRVGWWKKRLSEWRTSEAVRPAFAPAILVPPASTPISIRLPAGPVIEVADATAEWLSTFVAELARRG